MCDNEHLQVALYGNADLDELVAFISGTGAAPPVPSPHHSFLPHVALPTAQEFNKKKGRKKKKKSRS